METVSSVEFEVYDDPKKIMATVVERGAAAIHGYMVTETLARITAELRAEPMALDEDLESSVQRRQEMIKYALRGDDLAPPLPGAVRQAPLGIATESRGLAYYARQDGGFEWHPNEVMGHRYPLGHFIGPHRDYSDARGLIASATVAGQQDFFVTLDGDSHETRIVAEPGTVIFLRGFDGDLDRRPLHRVDPPKTPRLAFTIREVHKPWDKKKDAQW